MILAFANAINQVKIALAGAPNRKKYMGVHTTYKRRGPASPTILPIYREAL